MYAPVVYLAFNEFITKQRKHSPAQHQVIAVKLDDAAFVDAGVLRVRNGVNRWRVFMFVRTVPLLRIGWCRNLNAKGVY